MKKLDLTVWALVVATRDMFIGFIVGMSGAVLMAKLNPTTHRVVALLIPVGVVAGIVKGVAKFIFLNMSSALPSKGYRFDYPKFKMLILWAVVFLTVFLYSFGLDLRTWAAVPLQLLKENIILGVVDKKVWLVFIILVLLTGLLSYIYEPPYNEEEFLPLPEPAEDNIKAEKE